MIRNSQPTFRLSAPSPKRQQLSRFQTRAIVRVRLTNQAAHVAHFRLSLADSNNRCQFEAIPPRETVGLICPVQFTLQPNETAVIPIRLTPPLRPTIGLAPPIHSFSLTATAVDSAVSRTVLGQVRQTPLLDGWLLGSLTLLLMLIIGLSLPLLLLRPTPVVAEMQVATVTSTATPTPHRPLWLDIPPTLTPTATPTFLYERMFQQAAAEYDLDWRLLAATAYVESGFNPYALGRDGDMGLMQIIPTTWRHWSVEVGVSQPYDPHSNIQVGAAFMADMRQYCARYGYTDPRWMLVAYNWGPNNIRRLAERNGDWGDVPARQRAYTAKILQIAASEGWR